MYLTAQIIKTIEQISSSMTRSLHIPTQTGAFLNFVFSSLLAQDVEMLLICFFLTGLCYATGVNEFNGPSTENCLIDSVTLALRTKRWVMTPSG